MSISELLQIATIVTIIFGIGKIVMEIGTWKAAMESKLGSIQFELDKLSKQINDLIDDKHNAWKHITRLENTIEQSD